MKIILIAAIGQSGQLGLNQDLPWRVRGDLIRFKKRTMSQTLVVGRNTWESLPPLPGREMIVVTSKPFDGVDCVATPEEAVRLARQRGVEELFIAGGAKLYESAFSLVETLELSMISYDGPADTWFPDWNQEAWRLLEKEEYLEDPIPWVCKIYQRHP